MVVMEGHQLIEGRSQVVGGVVERGSVELKVELWHLVYFVFGLGHLLHLVSTLFHHHVVRYWRPLWHPLWQNLQPVAEVD